MAPRFFLSLNDASEQDAAPPGSSTRTTVIRSSAPCWDTALSCHVSFPSDGRECMQRSSLHVGNLSGWIAQSAKQEKNPSKLHADLAMSNWASHSNTVTAHSSFRSTCLTSEASQLLAESEHLADEASSSSPEKLGSETSTQSLQHTSCSGRAI